MVEGNNAHCNAMVRSCMRYKYRPKATPFTSNIRDNSLLCLIHTHYEDKSYVQFKEATHMTLSFENLSTREPSPFADTLTAALLAFCDLLAVPVNLAGRAGANVAAKEVILSVWYGPAQDAWKSSSAFDRDSFRGSAWRFPVTSSRHSCRFSFSQFFQSHETIMAMHSGTPNACLGAVLPDPRPCHEKCAMRNMPQCT